ncbi:MAG: helix-turn-helix domain-containing protein [bacterium]|nr:helix-turn-helix domain-containing protein [bacterium]
MKPETQEQLRRQAIRLWRKVGKYKQIGDIIGVHAYTIGKWVRNYKKYGANSLKSQKRRRRMGEDRLLSRDQEIALQKEICDKSPDQLKLAYDVFGACS